MEADEYEGKWELVPKAPADRRRRDPRKVALRLGRARSRSLLCSTFRLRDFVDLEKPKPGDTVLIHYAGEVPSKTGGKAMGRTNRPKIFRRAAPTENEEQDESRGLKRPRIT